MKDKRGKAMKNKRKLIVCVLALTLVLTMIPFSAAAAENNLSDEVVILYSGDMNGNVDDNIGVAGLAAYSNEMRISNKYVEIIDAGDATAGTVLASISKGEFVVEAMNAADYKMAVPGRKEFCYGMKQLDILSELAEFPYISCNLRRLDTGKTVFKPYRLETYGKTKIAYVGISDPDIMVQYESFFKNSDGSYAYSFAGDDNGRELYDEVQAAIDAAKKAGADYVIAVGNLRDNMTGVFSAKSIIENTSGINAFINSGSGKATAGEQVKTEDGGQALLTSPGGNISSIGVIKLSAGKSISSQIINSYNLKDIAVKDKVDALTKDYSSSLGEAFAKTGSRLQASGATGERFVEMGETNLGDLAADAYKAATGADIAFVEASEIKANIEVGSISYNDVIRAFPGNRSISVAKLSGFDIMDALEMSVRLYPSKNSGFLQVAGITFDIQETVIPSVTIDGLGNFVSVDDNYRVTNVMINGKPLDLMESYTVAGTNRLLNGDTGYKMLANGPFTKVNVATDNQAVIDYIMKDLKGLVGGAYSKSQVRIDSIKLARQSEINALIDKKAEEKLADYKSELQKLRKEIEVQDQVIAMKTMSIKAVSSFSKSSKGKRSIKVTWKPSGSVAGMKYQLYKSTKKVGGYKKLITTSGRVCTNTSGLTKGKTYYYKVRGYKYLNGKYYYTPWSNITYKKVTK